MARQSLLTKATRRKPAEITASREDAIGLMNSALKRQFQVVEKSVNDLRAENLRYYHKIGEICEKVRNDPGTYVGKDGTSAMKLIERALSTQARTLRKAAMFAQMYDQAQLEALIGLTNPENKFQLHWGHVSFLLTVTKVERREQFAQEAVQKMLDPAALHDLIKKRTQRGGGHGRKHEMPKTIAAQIRQMLTLCKQFMGKHTDVWNGEDESVVSNLLNAPAAEIDQEMVDQLREVITLMQEVSDGAGENVSSLERAWEHMNAALERRVAEEANAAAGRSMRSVTVTPRGAARAARATAVANAQ